MKWNLNGRWRDDGVWPYNGLPETMKRWWCVMCDLTIVYLTQWRGDGVWPTGRSSSPRGGSPSRTSTWARREKKKEKPRRVTSGCGMEAIGRKMQKPRPLRDIVRELAHTGKFVTLPSIRITVRALNSKPRHQKMARGLRLERAWNGINPQHLYSSKFPDVSNLRPLAKYSVMGGGWRFWRFLPVFFPWR